MNTYFKQPSAFFLGIFLILISCNQQQATTEKSEPVPTGAIDRTVLPIHEPDAALFTELNVKNTTSPPRFEVKAPENAPNVVIILLDDMGFGVPEHIWWSGTNACGRQAGKFWSGV